MSQNFHDIINEEILNQDENKLTLTFSIPVTSDFFDGHFPEFKLLPAVAQFEIVTRFCRKYFHTQRYIPTIKRIKFSAPIRPDTNLILDLSRNVQKGTITYSLKDKDVEDKIYSSGSFSVIDE